MPLPLKSPKRADLDIWCEVHDDAGSHDNSFLSTVAALYIHAEGSPKV